MSVSTAIGEGRLGERLWLYSNYHCNLTCTYCLTESAPSAPARELPPQALCRLAREAASLGFTAIGITGGEPFLVPSMPGLIGEIAEVLPVLVLSNGTLFEGERLARLRPLGARDVRIQISLDRSTPIENDAMRGPENFRRVVEGIPRLVELGIGVRIATTVETVDTGDLEALCALHRSLGVPDEDHVVRGIVRRGRARSEGLGEEAGVDRFSPELTITADGAFWSPFGPTVTGGRLDTDLLVTRVIDPLRHAADAIVRLVESGPVAAPVEGFT